MELEQTLPSVAGHGHKKATYLCVSPHVESEVYLTQGQVGVYRLPMTMHEFLGDDSILAEEDLEVEVRLTEGAHEIILRLELVKVVLVRVLRKLGAVVGDVVFDEVA